VLVGTLALNTYRDQARATQDVDILVRRKDLPNAVRVLSTSFPGLRVNDFSTRTRFTDPAIEMEVIDVIKPTQAIYQAVSRHTIPIGDSHEIPDLEATLASKFAVMVSAGRRLDKRYLDGGDFMNVFQHNRSDIDVRKLRRLAEKLCPRSGARVRRLIKDIDADRMIQV